MNEREDRGLLPPAGASGVPTLTPFWAGGWGQRTMVLLGSMVVGMSYSMLW